jgi:RNA polymerase sigma-70 factor (ECF subfamily)
LLRLAQALARLPEDQRRVVELHYLKGMTVADVAEQIGRTRPAAVGLLFRARPRPGVPPGLHRADGGA